MSSTGSSLAWSSYLGGNSDDFGFAIDVDSTGNVYVTGYTESTNFPTGGGFDASLAGVADAFVTKVNAAGSSLAWSSYLGGNGMDQGSGIVVDATGNVYLSGDTSSNNFPAPGGFDGSLGGGRDAFVAKVNASGSSLAWSSHLGGSGLETSTDLARDAAGDVYLTGYTSSSDFPTTGGFDTTYGGGAYDAFVAKVSASGSSLLWSSYLGGAGDDYGQAIALDSATRVHVTGHTTSASGFPTAGGFDTTLGGMQDGFVTKVDAGGSSLVWSSYLGGGAGAGNDYAREVTVDGAGNVYVTGETYSIDFPATGGFDTTREGTYDAFVTKVNAAGSSLAWSSYLGGSGSDRAWGIRVDGAGNVYVAGETSSSNFPATGGFQTTLGGGQDGFVTKVNAAGSSLAWSSYIGGTSSDSARSLAVDSAGNVYVTGQTSSTNFPSTGGFDTSLGGTADAFVAKVNAAGSSLAWSSYLGGSGSELAHGVAVDGSGSAYLAGQTSSADFPSAGGFDAAPGGSSDAFVAKVNATGSSLAWSSYLGGSGGEDAFGMTVDGSGNLYVTGYTGSTDFPTPGGFDTTLAGGVDIYVTKVNASGSTLAWSSYLGGTGSDFGAGVALDPSGNVYVAGTTSSTDFPTPGGFDTTHGGGGYDAYAAKISATGSGLLWSTYLGGSASDEGYGVSADSSGRAYVTGFTASGDFPVAGGFDSTLGPVYDAFVVRIDEDLTAPTVTSDQAVGQADPTNASPIMFTVAFSEPVSGFTTGDVTLSGTAGATTAIVSGGPTTYTVTVSGMAGSGTVTATIGAGVAVDLSGNPNAGSTSTDNAVTYDVAAPSVTVNQAAGQPDPTGASPILFTVVFSEPVSGFATGDVTLSGTAGATTAIVSGGPTTYTVAVSGMAGSGTVIATVGAGVATDAAGNPNLAWTSADNSVAYDLAVPSVSSVNSATPNGAYGAGASIDVTVNFTEPVTLAGGNLLVTLDTGAVVSIGPFGPAGSASATYTVAAGQNSADLNAANPLTLSAGATLRDAASNDANLSVPPGQNLADLKAILVDTTSPGVATVTSTTANGAYRAGQTVNVTVSFSEPVALAGGNLLVTLDTGAVVSIAPFSLSTSASGTYAIGAGQNSSDLNASSPLALAAGATLRDAAGNNALLSIPAGQNLADLKAIVIDTIAPTATITSPTSGTTFTTGSTPVALGGTASDGVGVAGVTWSNAANALSGTATGTLSWSASVPLAVGANAITVTATDTAGNTGTDTITVTYDPNVPTVTINSPTSGPTWSTSSNSIALGGTASDDVAVVGVGWSNAANGQSGPATGTTSWSATVPLAPGTNVITVTATDGAGNPGSDTITVTYDNSAPTVASVTSSTANGTYGLGSNINVTVTFSEAVTLAGGNLLVALDTGAVVSIAPFGSSTSASGTYTVGAGQSSPDLNATSPLTLSGGATLRDGAGNNAVLAIPGGQSIADLKAIVVDGAVPAVMRVTSTTPDGGYGQGASINVTVDFSEPVTLAGGNLLVTLDTGAVVSIPAFGPAASASATYTVGTGQNSSDLTAASPLALSGGATLRDGAGNSAVLTIPGGQNIANLKAIVVDTASPTVAIGSPTTGSTYTTSAALVSLGGTTTDNLAVTTVAWSNAANGQSGTAAGTASWTASVPLALGTNAITVTATDAGGNTATDTLTVTRNPDTTVPTAAITSPTGGSTYVTSTSPLVLGGTASDDAGVTSVTWSNAATGQSGTAAGTTSWSATVPLRPGTNLVTVFVWDAAGNVTTATLTVDYTPADTTPPTVAISAPSSTGSFSASATPVTVAGTASDDTSVAGVTWSNAATGAAGTASGTATWTASVPLTAGTNVITVTATDSVGHTSTASITIDLVAAGDASTPSVTITVPTSAATYSATSTPLALGGTAWDDVGISVVRWVNGATGANGLAAGTDSWTASVPLFPGGNLITVTARDPAGNVATDTIDVTYTPAAGDSVRPIVAILSPTSAPTLDTSADPVVLGGMAADDVALNAVVWSNAATGQSGSASGLSTWTASVPLAGGANAIAVTAYDTSGNAATATIAVNLVLPAGGGGGGRDRCGTTGLELFWPLGLVWLLRRSRRKTQTS